MTIRPDLSVLDSTGRQILVIEVKNKRDTDSEWASSYRRNLLEHEPNWVGEYFLIATPDRLYLWDQLSSREPEALPSKVIDAAPLLEPLFERFHVDPDRVSGKTFEVIIGELVSDIFLEAETVAKSLEGLDSEFVSAVRDGKIAYPAAA